MADNETARRTRDVKVASFCRDLAAEHEQMAQTACVMRDEASHLGSDRAASYNYTAEKEAARARALRVCADLLDPSEDVIVVTTRAYELRRGASRGLPGMGDFEHAMTDAFAALLELR
jgi:hypothetical protein